MPPYAGIIAQSDYFSQSVDYSALTHKIMEGESTQRAKIRKQKLKVQNLHHRMENIRTDHSNKTISEDAETYEIA